MKNIAIKTTMCGMISAMMLASSGISAKATVFTAETPVAGVSVVLNNCYAMSSERTQVQSVTLPKGADLELSEFDNIAVSQVTDYVNVRSEPNTDSEILGKIYDGCAATIVGVEGDWYQVDSGSIRGGYIKAEYFVTGKEAEALAAELATKFAVVNTTTLYVRSEPTVDSACVTLVPLGEEFVVMEEQDGWAKIEVDATTSGWVCMDYLDCRIEFDTAVSVEEEQAKIEEQRAAEKRAEEARKALQQAQQEAAAAAARQAEAARQAAAAETQTPAGETPAVEQQSPVTVDVPTSAMREAIVSYALQFVGNPYVYGGNSLTNGTDCSGFVKLIYAEFGYSLERRASLQYKNNGIKISVDQVQPGDLIFYGNGEVDHVTMYIGNGQVVHASTEKTGIKISSMNYRTTYGAVRILN